MIFEHQHRQLKFPKFFHYFFDFFIWNVSRFRFEMLVQSHRFQPYLLQTNLFGFFLPRKKSTNFAYVELTRGRESFSFFLSSLFLSVWCCATRVWRVLSLIILKKELGKLIFFPVIMFEFNIFFSRFTPLIKLGNWKLIGFWSILYFSGIFDLVEMESKRLKMVVLGLCFFHPI